MVDQLHESIRAHADVVFALLEFARLVHGFRLANLGQEILKGLRDFSVFPAQELELRIDGRAKGLKLVEKAVGPLFVVEVLRQQLDEFFGDAADVTDLFELEGWISERAQ